MKSWSKSQYLTTTREVSQSGNSNARGFTFQQTLPDAGNYTVQFRISAQTALDGSNNVGNVTPTARIQWSIGGNTVQRIISIYDGASLTGVGDHVRVDVYDETNPNDIAPGYEQKYLVAVTVSEGERGANKQPPTYTQYIVNGGNIHFGSTYVTSTEGDFAVPVPLDAGVISVFVTAYGFTGRDPASPAILTEDQVSVALLTADNIVIRQYDPRDYDWVPLPPQCRAIDLRNNMGTSEEEMKTILFAVTFGIDG